MMPQKSAPVYGQYKWFSVEINGLRHPPSPCEDTVIREKHFNAVCLRQNKLPFCWMFAFCLLWAWVVPWWLSQSKAAKLMSLCLSSLSPLLPLWRLTQSDKTSARFPSGWFDLTSPVPSCLLALCVRIQMRDWPGRDPRLNPEAEMKDGLVQLMTLHPSWELDLTLLPKACTDNEPLRYYAPSETFHQLGGSLDNLV